MNVSKENWKKIAALRFQGWSIERISEHLMIPQKELEPDFMEVLNELTDSKAGNKPIKKRRGKKAHNIKKVILNDKYVYNSITEASNETGVSITSISNNINGLSKTTKKGVWKIY